MITTKLYALLITLCRIATGLAFGLLIVTVMTQVISRTFLTGSPVWTEELTRFALLFMAAFGAGLSFRNGEMVNVDMICEMLPAKFQRILLFVSASLTAVFCLMLVMPAWKFVSIGVMQTSPALGLRMDFVHVTVFILLVLLGLFAILRVVRMIAGASDGKPEGQSENLS
ncbi:MAG: TRAP transporter small permease [Pseudomonadota bacterium]